MSSDKVGSTAGGFIRNFFALLGTDQASAEHEEQVVGKDTCSPLPLAPDQRLAFAKVLPEWVRLLTAAPRAKKRKPSRPTDVSGRRTFPRSESFFDGTLMDQWLELPHLAPIPSPWVKPCTSASYSSRHRLLQNLQRRYELVERGDRKGNKSQCFVRDFLRTLNLHRDTTEQSIGRTEFLCVVEELVDGTSTEEGNEKEPPLALLAELLFSEWCVAGGGDASFASTRVALQVIEADLRAYEKEGGEDPTKVIHSHNEGAVVDGEENSIVVGTLAALACAHPMTPDTQTSDVASTTGFRKRSAVRSGSAFSALELDDEVEEDGDVEEDEFDDSASKENTGVENAKGVRKLGAIVEESTCAFNVPLASVVLTTYRVTEHGNNPSSVTEQHVKLEDGEIYSRRGALRWFTVGNSKRHRNFLESKSKFLVGGPAFDISSAHKKAFKTGDRVKRTGIGVQRAWVLPEKMHDGVRLALPEGAAQFSGVLRRALESWAESYGPPPASATDDGCARACSDPERTPDRLGDEEEEEDRLSGIKSLNLSSINERKTRTPSLKQVLDSKGNGSVRDVDGFEGVVVGSSEDTDGTVSVLDDDESDSPSRGDAIQTSSYGLFNRSKEGDQGQGGHSVRKGRNGVNVSQRESCAVGSTGGAVLNPEPRQAGSLRNEPDEAEREYLDSATPSTLDNDDYDEEMNEDDEGEYVGREISQQKPVRGGGKETSSQLNTAAAPVCMSTFSPVAENGVQGSDDKRVETRPYPTPFPSPSALSREDYTHRVCSGQSQTIASEQHTDTTAVGPSVSLVTLVAETITAKSPSRDELEGRQMLATESRSGTTSLTPCNQTNEGVTSPSNYHQRTPCMIGDEDDVLFLSGSCISFSNEDFNPAAALSLQQLSSASKEFVSPVNNSNSNSNRAAIEPLTPPQQQLNNLGFDGSSHSNHRQPDTGDNVKANVSGPPEICPLQQCAYITEREIIIELQNSLSLTEPSSARRSHDDESTKSLNTFSSSKAMTQVPPTSSARMSQSFKSATRGTLLTSNNTDSDTKVFGGSAEYLKLAPATSSIVVDMHERHSAQPVSALSPGERTEPLAQSPTLDAAALCATYLCHFSGNQQDHQGTFHPTITPEPLSAPLVALLTSWERNFLYCDVLGYTPEQLSSAMAIVQEAPKMNYLNPAPFLRNPTVTKALLVDSPTAERMSLLMRIIKMSEALQIPTLYNLCVAWCADFVTRTCYGAGDHFTAAALVRECFHVENDWSRKEMDCLKLENEWPVDEED